nr:hypothetical protein [Frondihabitans sucicola]
MLWLVTSLGVVTLGPATSALQRTLHDVLVDGRPAPTRLYARHLAAAFRRLWLVGVVGAAVVVMYVVALLFWTSAGGAPGVAALVILLPLGGLALALYLAILAAAPRLPDDAGPRELARAGWGVLTLHPLAGAGRVILMATWLLLLSRLPTLGLIGLGLVPAFLALTITWRPAFLVPPAGSGS